LGVVVEDTSGGSLRDLMSRHRGNNTKIEEKVIGEYAVMLLEALAEVHKYGLPHKGEAS